MLYKVSPLLLSLKLANGPLVVYLPCNATLFTCYTTTIPIDNILYTVNSTYSNLKVDKLAFRVYGRSGIHYSETVERYTFLAKSSLSV